MATDAEDFEGAANNATLNTSTTVFGTVNAGWEHSTDYAVTGTRSAHTSDSGSTFMSYAPTDGAVFYQRLYVRVQTALPAANMVLIRAYQTTGPATRAQVRLKTDGTFDIRNGTTSVATSTFALTTGAWVRLEWLVDETAGVNSLRIFHGANLNGSTADETLTSSALATGVTTNQLDVGQVSTPSGVVDLYLDAWAYSTAGWVGPAAAGATFATTVAAATGDGGVGALLADSVFTTVVGAATGAGGVSTFSQSALGGTFATAVGAATASGGTRRMYGANSPRALAYRPRRDRTPLLSRSHAIGSRSA